MRLLLLFMLIASSSCYGQDYDDSLVGTRIWKVPSIPRNQDAIEYSGTIKLGNEYSQKRLYKNAHDWARYNLVANRSIINKDSLGHMVSGTSELHYEQTIAGIADKSIIYFSYEVRVQDRYYSYRIFNIRGLDHHSMIDYNGMYKEDQELSGHAGQWTVKERYEILSDLHSYMTLLTAGLQNRMLE